MSSAEVLKRKRARRFCDHCNRTVSHANFYLHKKRFFRSGMWMKEAESEENSRTDEVTEMEDCVHVVKVEPSQVEDVEWGFHFDNSVFPEGENAGLSASPLTTDDLLRQLIRGQNVIARQLETVINKQALLEEAVRRVEDTLSTRLEQLHEDDRCQTELKKVKRVCNVNVAEGIRRLHNSEKNQLKFDPQMGIMSPHNQAVLTFLLEEFKTSYADTDTESIKAAGKTYYETLRRKFTLSQPDKAHSNTIRTGAKRRQRKRRLLESRARMIQTPEESEIWQTASVELMSDEEDDVLNGQPVWIVRSPLNRSQQLTDLCHSLQQRLESDQRYTLTHTPRLRAGENGPS